jgi:hypothetical protein
MEVLPHDGTFFAVVFRVLAAGKEIAEDRAPIPGRKKIGSRPPLFLLTAHLK